MLMQVRARTRFRVKIACRHAPTTANESAMDGEQNSGRMEGCGWGARNIHELDSAVFFF